MDFTPCRSYHGKLTGKTVVRMPDGKSVFKVYFISIVGRDKPERFEWEKSEFKKEQFEQLLRTSGREGIGFATAFPHITKVFRFSPYVELALAQAAGSPASSASVDR